MNRAWGIGSDRESRLIDGAAQWGKCGWVGCTGTAGNAERYFEGKQHHPHPGPPLEGEGEERFGREWQSGTSKILCRRQRVEALPFKGRVWVGMVLLQTYPPHPPI
jgi:hypothetical protein